MVPSSITRRQVVAAGLGTTVAGCMGPQLTSEMPALTQHSAYGFGTLRPLDLGPANLMRITVCLRPFRPSGPRLELEQHGDRTTVHNYGHGGAGWSLSWGYAEAVRDLLAKERPRAISVLGAGAIGLTSAIALAETGAKVTVFAREMPMESASSRATGLWSPSSRIGIVGAVGPAFAANWEDFARRSYARHLRYVGRAGHPVELTPRFYIRSQTPEPALVSAPEGADRFLGLGRNLRGLTPPWTEREVHPFPADTRVRGGLVMTFNIAEYTRQLTEDFLAMGGHFERVDVTSQQELTGLPGDAIVNCSGIGAQTLANDKTLVPVRGQIAWMPPQSDRLYGIHHRGVTALSRRDGLLIQETGGSDYFGYGDASLEPDRQEFLDARAKVAPMFAW